MYDLLKGLFELGEVKWAGLLTSRPAGRMK